MTQDNRCMHTEIVMSWHEERKSDDVIYESWCSTCGQEFEVFWAEHDEPSELGGWKDGPLLGVELYIPFEVEE